MMIIDRLIGGPHHGERIDRHLIRNDRPNLPRTISTEGSPREWSHFTNDAAWAPIYNYRVQEGIARVGLTRYGLVTAALTRESEDVRFTAWVGQDVSADESMHLIHEMIANDLNGREADRRRGVYDIQRRMAERGRPISNDEIPDDYTARQIFERDEMGHPARLTLHELLDEIGDIQALRSVGHGDQSIVPNPGQAEDRFNMDRMIDYAREYIDRPWRGDSPEDHGFGFARLRAERAAREHAAFGPEGSGLDPMDVYEEINEYLGDASVGSDAMRCRPRREP